MSNLKRTVLSVSAMAAALCVASPSQAVVKVITPVYPGTVAGSLTYSNNESLFFKFTIAAPYKFTFTADGSGGTFPFPIDIEAVGTSGTYTEKFGPFPVHGTVDYMLTTAIPEPGVWILMVAGFGLVGFATRRRAAVVAA